MYPFISFLPILTLFVVCLWKGVKTGIYIGLVITIILFFYMEGTLNVLLAASTSALFSTISIMFIILGAILLYQVMDQKGFVNEITDSLSKIHPDRSFSFFFLSFFLTAFFESVAGFGTPGAIVPLLLISLGYAPVLSISTVLLIDGLFAMTGAVGTPVIAGLQKPLNLSMPELETIYSTSAGLLLVSGVAVVLIITRNFKKQMGVVPGKHSFILYLIVMLSYFAFSFYFQDLTGIMAALFLAIVSYLSLFKNKQLSLRPWVAYLVLVLLLLLPKIIPTFNDLLNFTVIYDNLYGTSIDANFQPFKSPLLPFVFASMVALYQAKDFKVNLRPVFTRTAGVFLVLFPSIIITQLMLVSNAENPSMVEEIASVFVYTGLAYPLLSPLIGVLGTFISGSTTVSNIIFGPMQLAASDGLVLSKTSIISLQLAGASIGNAVCLFNIIAAAAVADVKNYKAIFKINLLPTLLVAIICGTLGYVLLYFS